MQLIPRDAQFYDIFTEVATRMSGSASLLHELFKDPRKIEQNVAEIKKLAMKRSHLSALWLSSLRWPDDSHPSVSFFGAGLESSGWLDCVAVWRSSSAFSSAVILSMMRCRSSWARREGS